MKTITISPDSEFKNIQETLNSLDSLSPITIYLKNGIYQEKIIIKNDNITIIGEDQEKTILSYNDYALKIHQDGQEYNTFRTASVMILGNNVKIENVSIINTAGSGSKVGQAVALAVYGDNFLIKNSKILGHQDTLFCGPLPRDLQERYQGFLSQEELNIKKQSHQIYQNCFIQGDVDFIFGSAQAIFNNCTIYSNKHDKDSYITAPSTEADSEYGFIFYNCNLIGDANQNSVYLSRPWRENGYSCFINCQIGNHIKEEGFSIWDGTDRHLKARYYYYNLIKNNQIFIPSYYLAQEIRNSLLEKTLVLLNKIS